MKRDILTTLGISALVMLLTTWYLYPGMRRGSGTKYQFLHCPNCLHEVPYLKDMAGRPCPRCQVSDCLLVPTEQSVAGSASGSPYSPLFLSILIETLILMALIWYLAQPHQRRQVEEEYLRIRCRKCQKKLRYAASRAGHTGQCPRCKHSFAFPDLHMAERE